MDRYSPVAPAAVRVQILPIGQIERKRFLDIVRQLQHVASIVRLSAIDGDSEDLLSPKGSPDGCLLFNYTTSEPSEQLKQLAPYELFREPLLVVGLIDETASDEGDLGKELQHATAYLRERHSRVVHRQVLSLRETEGNNADLEKHVVAMGQDGNLDEDSLKVAMCKVASQFLVELATYTKAMQASPSIQTPARAGRRYQRPSSLNGVDRNSGSGFATPTQSQDVSSPIDGGIGSSPPPARGFGSPPPATTFDQIHGANVVPTGLARSDSNSSRSVNRTASQDRAGGQSLSKKERRDRGKARVGVVVGHIYMMAGHWSDALRLLVEHTNKARLLSDRLWQAKGLDGIMVCMILLSWAGLEFQIPSISYPPADRSSSGHMSRFSVSLSSDFKPTADGVSVRRLSTSMPEMLKQILDLYRSSEAGLELPPLLVYESTIRFCKVMTILFNANSELTKDVLASLVEDNSLIKVNRNATFRHTSLSKIAIDEILKQARPADDDGLGIDDRISILAGMATVYAILPMDRKKGLILQDLVKTTTWALDQARKLGAAEMGIHPAATLSTDTSTDAILAILGESGGVNNMMVELAGVYGTELLSMHDDTSQSGTQSANGRMTPSHPGFGNATLQSDILKSIAAYCEASPDPVGVLQVATSVLMSINPYTAVDTIPHTARVSATREDQIRVATIIGRTIGISKQMGLPQVQAEYWDPFLVRGLSVTAPDIARTLVSRSRIGQAVEIAQQTPGNPLLYDPNASRPGTANPEIRHTLVWNEPTKCTISLQNPFDIPLEVEAMQLVTSIDDANGLRCQFEPTTVSPMCIQRVPISISPTRLGDITITGCKVKVSGCREQLFPIISQPWSLSPSLLVKHQGLDAQQVGSDSTKPEVGHDTFQRKQVLATCVSSQPLLQMEQHSSSPTNLTLLEGQRTSMSVAMRNVSGVAASIFRKVGTADVLSFREKVVHEVPPSGLILVECELLGKAGVNEARMDLFYASLDTETESEYARVLPVSLRMTVKPSLAMHDIDVTPSEADNIDVSFNIVNNSQEALRCYCDILAPSGSTPHSSQADAMTIVAGGTIPFQSCVSRDATSESDADIGQQLLERISLRWETVSGPARQGAIDLTNVELTKAHIDVIRGPSLDVSLELMDREGSKIDLATSPVKAGSFVTVRVNMTNRKTQPTKPLFMRLLLPADDRRVGLIGVPTRIVGVLVAKGSVTTDFALCLLSSGRAEVGVVAKAMGEEWMSERSIRIKVT